ncbi:MAG: SDR family oxidoreductase [Sphingobacteriia bacterium]|nr:SDR family oxidoreductase [Sphingobacteriia bacterium]
MQLELENRLFLVCGATAGFGGAIAHALLNEGAKVIAVARNRQKLEELRLLFPDRVETISGDLSRHETPDSIVNLLSNRALDGMLVNAGGPPAKSFIETEMQDWDAAYASVLRWKIALVKALLPKFRKQRYGRMVFVESISVKQPVENLVLSNSMRLAVVGFVKTLSQEIAAEGITCNILAPGYHDTNAVKRVIQKKSDVSGLDYTTVQKQLQNTIPAGRLGDPAEFASLALWLLSPLSGYITGQTISVDGGVMLGSFG